MESIEEKFNQYQKIREANSERHNHWNTTARKSLRDFLSALIDRGPLLGWRLSKEDDKKSVQGVTLMPPKVESYSPIDLHYGKLVFFPIHNGKIATAIVYPRYGDNRERVYPLGTTNPEELKQELVAQHVQSFISDLSRWEQSNNADSGEID